MATSVNAAPDDGRLDFQTPTPLFQTGIALAPSAGGGARKFAYAAAPDGSRFLINTNTAPNLAAPITVVLNWAAGVTK